MIEKVRCPKCDAEIPPGAPAGLCPQCLLQAGLDSQQPAARQFPPTQPSPPSPASAFVPPAPEELAARFPQLEILTLLGRGGMGAVYKAKQRGLDRLVALKILPPEVSSDPAFAERFTREARSLAKLTHSNIVTVYDFGQAASAGCGSPDPAVPANEVLPSSGEPQETVGQPGGSVGDRPQREADGLFYFLMEFVDGVNLRQAIQAGDLTPKDALAIVPQICEALQFAHDEGIVHRDIKPENILIDKRGRVKIADFGLAKLMANGGRESPGASLTATHQVMGTLRYMAPEQMQGSRAVDHRADIYSLGVVFYELLTGELPMGKFAPPSKRVQVDVRLDEVVLRALEADPDYRYQHASEVKTDVDAISRDSHPPNLNEQKPARQVGRTARAEPVSLPFEIAESVHWGLFGEVHGKLRLGISELVVEFEVRSLFPFFRAGLKEVSIPFDDIESVNWDGWALTLRTKTMKALAEIPNSSQGQVAFDFSMADLDVPGGISEPVEQFLACLPSRLAGKCASVARPESAKRVAMPAQPEPTPLADSGRATRPKLVPVLATCNLVGAILLMLVFAMEEPAAFAEPMPRLWQIWETVDAVLGFSLAAGMFAASIGLFLWKPWARKLTLGVCIFGLASVVFDAPYLARFALPDFYAEIQQTVIAEGVEPEVQGFVALFTMVVLFGGLFVMGLTWLIGQLVYFNRPQVVAAFESQGEDYGRFIEWLFTGAGVVVGLLSVFGPLALLLGVAAFFKWPSGDQKVARVPAAVPPLGIITSGIGAEFTVPAGHVATFEIVTRRDNATVPVPPHCGYVMAPEDTPVAGTFRWSRKPEEGITGDRSRIWSLEILTGGGGRGYSETILLPDELNAAVAARGLSLGLLEPNEEAVHWGTADVNDLPADGLIGLRVTVVPHGMKAGGSGNAHIDWKKAQSAQSTTRRKLPRVAP